MRNLKAALVIFGAMHIVQGLALIVAPDVEALASYAPYILAILGSTFIAAGVWFITTGLNPLQNITGIRLAILWAGLLLVIQLYTVAQGYIGFGQAWPGIAEAAIFAAAFLIFYPYRQR